MAENPASWGPLERVIFQALTDFHDLRVQGIVGLSEVRFVADALREAALVVDDPVAE